MSAIASETGMGGDVEPVRSRARLLQQVISQQRAAALGLAIIVFFVLLALFAPLVAPYSTTARSCAVFAPLSGSHLLGCDGNGVDVLSEIISGGRISLIIGFAATLISMVIGGVIGILAGYFGRWVDITLMRVTDYLLVIPDLAFAMVIADVWGPSLLHVIMVIGILEWASTARIIRAQVMSVNSTPTVFVNGRPVVGGEPSTLQQYIDYELGGTKPAQTKSQPPLPGKPAQKQPAKPQSK